MFEINLRNVLTIMKESYFFLFYGFLVIVLLISCYPLVKNCYRISYYYIERWLNPIDETEVNFEGKKIKISLSSKEPIVRQIRNNLKEKKC